MGNRAVIAFGNINGVKPSAPAVYLHWNGGLASVEGFLRAAKILNYDQIKSQRGRRDAFARMVQAWFGQGSVYVGQYADLDRDNGDNGAYLLNQWLGIEGREFSGSEEIDEPKSQEICREVMKVADARKGDFSNVELRS